jgi:hypothetical protein
MPQANAAAPKSKSQFIRELPANLPAAEVVSKAKEAGLSFSIPYVHSIRSQARKAGAKKPGRKPGRPAGKPTGRPVGRPPKAAAAKPSKPSSSRKQEKADFVRSMPASMSPKDIVAEAAKRGLSLSKAYVYILRGRTKPGASAPAAAKPAVRRGRPPRARVALAPATGETPEAAFVKLSLQLGLERAKSLLTAVDSKLADLIATVR